MVTILPRRITWGGYLKSVALLGAASVLGSLLQHSIAAANIVMLYILVVVITAIRWGKGPSVLAAALSVVVFDLFFVPPRFSLKVADYQYLIAFATLFAVGLVVSTLTLRVRNQANAAKETESRTATLYRLSKDLAGAAGSEIICDIALLHLGQAFAAEPSIQLCLKTLSGNTSFQRGPALTEAERAAMDAVMGRGRDTGMGSIVLPPGSGLLVPLVTKDGVIGAVVLRASEDKLAAKPEQLRLLETCANLIASALERVRLSEEARQAQVMRETETLQAAFMNSVSHDLRTPLVSITGSLSSVLQDADMNDINRRELLEMAYEQSYRLNRLVSDLLDMARVEAGALRLRRRPTDLHDLVGAAIKQVEDLLEEFTLTLDLPPNLPEVDLDFSLMLRVLANLLDNAARYSAACREIQVTARTLGEQVELKISDRGIGIPASDLEQVFNKFYRVKRPQTHKGTGLGLSVCRGIVEAHGGLIAASNREGGGTVVTIRLPLSPRD